MSDQTTPVTENPSLQILELNLTRPQFSAIQKLLPHGFSLELHAPDKSKNKRQTKKATIHPDSKALSEVDSIESHSRRSTRTKKGLNFDRYIDLDARPTTSSKSFINSNEGVRRCYNLVQKLKKHDCAGPFLEPVDVEGLGLVDYYDVVQEAMDLSTVEGKLRNGEYTSVNEFASDARKIWSNSFKYNQKGSGIYQMTVEMSVFFEKLFKEIENVSFNDTIRNLEKQVEQLTKQISHISGPIKLSYPGHKYSKSSSHDKPLTAQEKKILGQNIRTLSAENLRGVWEIVCKVLPNQENKEELEFDIDLLPSNIARDLERFVDIKLAAQNKIRSKKKGQKGEIREMPAMPLAMPFTENFGNVMQIEAMAEKPTADEDGGDESGSSESSFLSE